MRHILIILISILLLSSLLISCTENSPSPVIGDNLSPVIGDNHKGETLYGWGKCCDYVWKGFGKKDTNPKYQGEVENGVPNGQGTSTYPNGEWYVGSWKDGKENGQGTSTLYDGDCSFPF